MPDHPLRLGTRESPLALAQARRIAARLTALGAAVELVGITTGGDRDRASALAEIGGQGLFVRELEAALLDGRIDLAVHSLKDLPVRQPEGLVLAAVPERADPRDCLISREKLTLAALPAGTRLGSSSPRRVAQIKAARPDLAYVGLRGNVETRLRKVARGEVAATVLARAGLERLGLLERATETLEPEIILPAPGQGALAVECRAADAALRELLARLDDAAARAAVTAERAVLVALGGGCQMALGALAVLEGGRLVLAAALELEPGRLVRRQLDGPADQPEALGAALARALRE